MSKNITALESAEAAHAKAVTIFRTKRDEYQASIDAANEQIKELNRLDVAIRNGDASSAGQRLIVKGKADDLTEVTSSYSKAVEVAQRALHAAHMDVIVERLRADAGAMLSTPKLREMEQEAQQKIDAVLFELADAVSRSNAELSKTAAAIKTANDGGNVRSAISVRDDSNGKVLYIEGIEYREQTPSLILKNSVGHPETRWSEDRNAEAIAANKAEVEAKRADEAKRSQEDRELMAALDNNASSGKRKLTRTDDR